ncbi:baseplate J/gp47 family protein [Polaromonas sp. UC242_47]|uniref:baseplate J/gp47 family protein n=1 Tax=Polaromonas sp. UC242_47 TaxID=3374626 RepID=UPI0037B29D61
MTPLNVPIPSIRQAAENAARLLQQSLSQAAQVADPASLSSVDLELARSNVKALAFVEGAGLHGAYRYLRDFIARQAIPIKSVGEFLDGWLETYGLKRKEPAAAIGPAGGTGVPGTLLTTGTLMADDQGRQFRVTSDVAVAVGGTVTPGLIATVTGIAGNAVAGLKLTLVSPMNGIDSAFTVGVDGLGGGADQESDDQAIYRLQQRLSNEPMGGCPADYVRWALQLPGITRAWGVRNPAGPTSAGVIIMADGNVAPGLPSAMQQRQVLDYIRDPKRGPPDELFVIIPTAVTKNWVLSITPDTADNRKAVIAAVQDLFFREAIPGGQIPHSHVKEVISASPGEYNHNIMSPVLTEGGIFTVASIYELLASGSFTFVP